MKPIDQSTLERIDAYLLGHMPDGQRMEFENELRSNPELQQALEEQQQLRHAVGYRQIQSTLADIQQAAPRSAGQRRKIWPILAIAASFLLVIALLFWLPEKSPKADIYAEFYTQDPGLPTVMGGQDAKYLFYEGMVQYKAGNYTQAIETWRNLPEGVIGPDTVAFYLSMAHLGKDDYTSARHELRKITGSAFENKIRWYSALIALRIGEREKATEILETMSTEPGPFQEAARALLQRLNTH